jgi:hypothetical protein
MRSIGGRRPRATLFAVLAAGHFGAGCTDHEILPPGDARALLIAAVVAGSDSVFVSVGRSGIGRPNQPVQAELVLHRATGDIPLFEADPARCAGPDGFACYVGAAAPPIANGETITLSGTAHGVGALGGDTTVPPPPQVVILGTNDADTVHVGSLSVGPPPVLGLPPGEGALTIAATDGFRLEATVWTASVTQTCSILLLPANQDLRPHVTDDDGGVPLQPGDPSCNGPPAQQWDSMAVALPVMLYDEHLSGWLRSGELVSEPSRFGVEGIRGVFGSASVRVLVLIATP